MALKLRGFQRKVKVFQKTGKLLSRDFCGPTLKTDNLELRNA